MPYISMFILKVYARDYPRLSLINDVCSTLISLGCWAYNFDSSKGEK